MKLNKREISRLAELAKGNFRSLSICPTTTKKLIDLGLADEARVTPLHGPHARITDAGRKFLADAAVTK